MPLDSVVQEVARMVADYGVAVMGIGGEDGTVPFAYTVGLTARGHPELILTGGVKPEYARQTLTMMGLRVINDGVVYTAGMRLDDILEGYEVVIAGPATAAGDRQYPINMARRIYGPETGRPLQVVYPDRSGVFPWQDGYENQSQVLICPAPPEIRTPQEIADQHPACTTAPNGTGMRCACPHQCANWWLRAAGYKPGNPYWTRPS